MWWNLIGISKETDEIWFRGSWLHLEDRSTDEREFGILNSWVFLICFMNSIQNLLNLDFGLLKKGINQWIWSLIKDLMKVIRKIVTWVLQRWAGSTRGNLSPLWKCIVHITHGCSPRRCHQIYESEHTPPCRHAQWIEVTGAGSGKMTMSSPCSSQLPTDEESGGLERVWDE
jgi:hypothetical protein